MTLRELLITGLTFSSGAAANVGSAFLKEPNWSDGLWLGLGALLFIVSLVLQQRASVFKRFQTSRARKVPAERRKVLVLFLSTVAEVPDWVRELQTGILEEDLHRLAETKRDNPGRRWSWEQPLRGIYHHLQNNGPLERLVLIGSTLSVGQLGEFYRLLQRYPEFQGERAVQVQAFLKNHMELKRVEQLSNSTARENGFDFEDFDDMAVALDQAIQQIKAAGYADRDIQVDYTGGQKPTSVVAAAATFGNYLTNQYVATNPSDAGRVVFDVWGYDFTEELPRAGS